MVRRPPAVRRSLLAVAVLPPPRHRPAGMQGMRLRRQADNERASEGEDGTGEAPDRISIKSLLSLIDFILRPTRRRLNTARPSDRSSIVMRCRENAWRQYMYTVARNSANNGTQSSSSVFKNLYTSQHSQRITTPRYFMTLSVENRSDNLSRGSLTARCTFHLYDNMSTNLCTPLCKKYTCN